MEDLKVTQNTIAIKFEGVWGELESKQMSGDNKSQNICGLLYFSNEIPRKGKRLISIFQEFSAKINKNLIFEGRLSNRL